MKAVFVTACLGLFLLLSGQSYGQFGGMGMGRGSQFNQPTYQPPSAYASLPGTLAERETKWLKDSLALTKDQLKAVKKLNNDYARQQQDAIKDISGTKGGVAPTAETTQQVRETMTLINEEKQDALRALLTPEQWAKYQTSRATMWKETGGFYQQGLTKMN